MAFWNRTTTKLTKAQRRALFTMGAFGSWKRYGDWGRMPQARVRLILQEEPTKYVTFNMAPVGYEMTDAGRERFKKEFGEPCSKHGWSAITALHKRFDDGTFPSCCAECRQIVVRVDGYEPKHFDMSCKFCCAEDSSKLFDMDALDVGEPITIAAFLRVNEECPPDPKELAELRACPVGGSVNLGIGGGFVTVKRTA